MTIWFVTLGREEVTQAALKETVSGRQDVARSPLPSSRQSHVSVSVAGRGSAPRRHLTAPSPCLRHLPRSQRPVPDSEWEQCSRASALSPEAPVLLPPHLFGLGVT